MTRFILGNSKNSKNICPLTLTFNGSLLWYIRTITVPTDEFLYGHLFTLVKNVISGEKKKIAANLVELNTFQIGNDLTVDKLLASTV